MKKYNEAFQGVYFKRIGQKTRCRPRIENSLLSPRSRSADTTKKEGLATKQLSMSRFTLVFLLTILFKILKNVSLLNLLKQKNEVTAS